MCVRVRVCTGTLEDVMMKLAGEGKAAQGRGRTKAMTATAAPPHLLDGPVGHVVDALLPRLAGVGVVAADAGEVLLRRRRDERDERDERREARLETGRRKRGGGEAFFCGL